MSKMEQIYWTPNDDFLSDDNSSDSIPEVHGKSYVDPWDLENYAYIRDHLDSIDLNSDSSNNNNHSSGEFATEANSTSFYYIPATKVAYSNNKKVDKGKTNADLYQAGLDQGNYVAIDEIRAYERNRLRKELRDTYGTPTDYLSDEFENNSYEEGISYNSHEQTYGRIPAARLMVPTGTTKSARDRSLSFSYGDTHTMYDPYQSRQSEIYSRLDELPAARMKKDSLPIYDHYYYQRGGRKIRSPNFGLTNYGHLKIDYSYSWNNLNKYIRN